MNANALNTVEAINQGDPFPIAFAKMPYAKQLQIAGREIANGRIIREADLVNRCFDWIKGECKVSIRKNKSLFRSMSDDQLDEFQSIADAAILNHLAYAKEFVYFNAGGCQIFELSKRLVEMMSMTDAAAIPVEMVKLPYDSFFVSLKAPTPFQSVDVESESKLVGFYIRKLDHQIFIMPMGVPSRKGLNQDFGLDWLLSNFALLSTRIILTIVEGQTLGECVENAIEDFKKRTKHGFGLVQSDHNSPVMSSDLSKLIAANVESDVNAWFESGSLSNSIRELVNLVVNTLCFITSYRSTGKEGWSATADRKKSGVADRARAAGKTSSEEKELAWAGYRRITMFRAPDEDEDGNVLTRQGTSPISHWRKGHWRNQAYGEGRLLRRAMWILPMMVNRDQGVIEIGHRYDVDLEPATA